jgi:hypothetical protein
MSLQEQLGQSPRYHQTIHCVGRAFVAQENMNRVHPITGLLDKYPPIAQTKMMKQP